jgi:hypothetical protein
LELETVKFWPHSGGGARFLGVIGVRVLFLSRFVLLFEHVEVVHVLEVLRSDERLDVHVYRDVVVRLSHDVLVVVLWLAAYVL